MADIKTRDAIKGTIKTIDKATIATERMKSAYAKTKDKAEQGCYVDENSATEYAADRISYGADRIKDEGIHQFNKQGQKAFKETRENIGKAKDKLNAFQQKRAAKQNMTEQHGLQIRHGAASRSSVPDSVQKAKSQFIKTRQQGKRTVKTTARNTETAVKAIIAGTKALISAIVAGGWVAVIIIIVICLIALLAGSVFGIFFSGEDSGNGMTMQSVVREINTEYDTCLDEIQNSTSYDVLEMSGSRAVWKEVLAVYSVKTTTDLDNPQEVATMDENKKQLLSNIFWEMNETVITESDDGHGNIVQTETTVTQTYLYITVSHKTAEEMADQYGFDDKQRQQLAELLAVENNSLWSQVLYGISVGDGEIVSVALSQVGNVGGQPYWSWYGFDGRVEWCACFVSWCANECGYIESGVIPKFAGCVLGSQWFKDRGQWQDGSFEPSAGQIIFFDWEGDGETDHVGIVEKCENGIVYTVEGNSGDACRQKQYAVGSSVIYGYGIPAY